MLPLWDAIPTTQHSVDSSCYFNVRICPLWWLFNYCRDENALWNECQLIDEEITERENHPLQKSNSRESFLDTKMSGQKFDEILDNRMALDLSQDDTSLTNQNMSFHNEPSWYIPLSSQASKSASIARQPTNTYTSKWSQKTLTVSPMKYCSKTVKLESHQETCIKQNYELFVASCLFAVRESFCEILGHLELAM